MRAAQRSQVEPFHVMQVLQAATVRQRTHGDAIMMCAGQPSSPAPAPVRQAGIAALRSEVLGYTETPGIRPLREAIAAYHQTRDGIPVDPDDVYVTTGSSGGFVAVFLAAFDVGDTVAMTRPGYPAYRNTLSALGCRVVELDGARTRFQPTVAQLEALPTPPAGVIVASPANPTGTIIDPDELDGIAAWCAANDSLLISDEIYHGISFGRATRSAWATRRDAVVIGSVSKYFSMTGYRVGWLLLPQWLRRPVDILSGNLSICPPAISQYAAVAAFGEESRRELDGHVQRYARNRDLLLHRLPALGITSYAPPDGAFYAWCDVSHLTDDSARWCADALEATGVALTPGIDFDTVDGPRYIRMSFAGDTADISTAIDRLAMWLGA